MPDWAGQLQLPQILPWLVPGVIIAVVRSKFLTGRLEGGDPSVRGAAAASLIYAAVFYPLVGDLSSLAGLRGLLIFYGTVLCAPFAIGIALGVASQKEPIRKLAEKCGLKIVHDIPSAWDYVFSRRRPEWMLVTLKDETKYRGCYVGQSFASSDPNERDLFLDQLAKHNEETDLWEELPGRSILICKDSILTVELVPSVTEKKDG